MSAIPEEFLKKTAQLSDDVTKPFTNSKKIYIEGSRPDIRVPMREISQADAQTSGAPELNPPITIYDTSGPYTDPEAKIDLMQGLPAVRDGWINQRGDTVLLDGPSSEFGRQRQNDPELANLRFEHIRTPRKAKEGPDNSGNVSQMHYAKNGIITPEMEYVAIRENNRLQELKRMPAMKNY